MKKSIIGLSLLALGLAGSAYAAETMQHGDPLGDKTMTKAEFMAKGADMFAQMDANHDGKLDQADRTAHEGQKFDQLDTNHDGNVSRDEFIAAHARGGMHDSAAMNADMGPAGMHSEDHGQERSGKGRDGGRGGMMMLKMADTNSDGVVSKDEFLAARAKHFDMIDTNHDGQFTKSERAAAHQKMRALSEMRHDQGHDGMMTPPPAPAY